MNKKDLLTVIKPLLCYTVKAQQKSISLLGEDIISEIHSEENHDTQLFKVADYLVLKKICLFSIRLHLFSSRVFSKGFCFGEDSLSSFIKSVFHRKSVSKDFTVAHTAYFKNYPILYQLINHKFFKYIQ
ncbi:hypothetical protein Q767_13800 [Flavobacterium enshiense DK69]|uniref:Uncharacterized protein n=1 Tax=Flavobacterium enshiense DK69 TaxID=1107311 RepID=A0A0A2MR95_9FLAO|nr:hypothetical protein Q767_13800 [Flavobacterium enshiense DK69]